MKQFEITGMSCAACSSRVEKAVSSLDGISACSVNLLTNSMSVEGDVPDEEVIKAVEKAGYGARIKDGKTNKHKEDRKDEMDNQSDITLLKNRFIFSVFVLLFLMYFSMGYVMFGFPVPHIFESSAASVALLQMILAAIVMIANQKFFINGFNGLVHKAPNMDTLVALGSFSAFLYSLVMLFNMIITGENHIHDLYFESAAMVVTLITLGKFLEAKAKGKTTTAIKSLMNLVPQKATVIRNGEQIEISADEVVVGDIFIVLPGESIVVDGVVIEGESSVDEAAITGESIPVDKQAGDFVTSATINLNGYLRCEAKRVGDDTTLAQIIKVVNDASATKAPIAKIADRVSGIFVPAVIVIAAVTLAVWLFISSNFGFALARAISVLVISCPCALGLATPVAIMVGSGIGAKNAILFKTATALETLGKADIVAFDKTGTITQGEPKVTDIIPCENILEDVLLEIAASLEKNSEHPLARAINLYAEKENISLKSVSEFKIFPGNGLCATIDDDSVYGGNLQFVEEKVKIDEELAKKASVLSQQGKTPLYFAKNSELLGVIAVSDTIKEDSADVAHRLKGMGIRTVMITGDNEKTAKAIGETVGIDELYADVKPDEKEKIIRSLQSQGKVIMVGDGINDAPALTRADVGVAVGAGTDIALDAADVVIVKSKMTDVVSAIKISKAVMRNIKENLFWAFGYNIIGIPLAAGVFIPFGLTMNPMFGAAAMSISSFLVVSNALRLNLIKLDNGKNNKKEKERMEKIIKIEGMMCPHCEARVKNILENLPHVSFAEVSHEKGLAKIALKENIDNGDLKNIIEQQGYKVISIEE